MGNEVKAHIEATIVELMARLAPLEEEASRLRAAIRALRKLLPAGDVRNT